MSHVFILYVQRSSLIDVFCNINSHLNDLRWAKQPNRMNRLYMYLTESKGMLLVLYGESLSEPEFYGDLVYRFRKIVGKSNFSEQFRKLINRYKRIGYSLDIMRQTACLVVNPINVDGYASLFNCTTAVRASDSMTASS